MTLDIMDGDLWQWDTGREVEAAGCEQVHFAKSTAGTHGPISRMRHTAGARASRRSGT